MANIDRFQTAERDFMRIAQSAGLPEPDEINYREEDDEVELVWRDQKLAVIVELDEYSDRCAELEEDLPF